jgi:hypothetical protein
MCNEWRMNVYRNSNRILLKQLTLNRNY